MEINIYAPLLYVEGKSGIGYLCNLEEAGVRIESGSGAILQDGRMGGYSVQICRWYGGTGHGLLLSGVGTGVDKLGCFDSEGEGEGEGEVGA